ncbi:hypothetical protein WOLCODRAFT_155116 [Wolfiporia cocos MD-104 SS10]|uniref:Uncharacterized protein n=1 Tax=Wolfiporia cocos (strain MD-104) TaxID=742152 RepID=A0A2H3K4M0_WOLCO|nr:hypothetical protein WOLCODRAFT_155116 [Wolfiporia cocos MD-104 SS10]
MLHLEFIILYLQQLILNLARRRTAFDDVVDAALARIIYFICDVVAWVVSRPISSLSIVAGILLVNIVSARMLRWRVGVPCKANSSETRSRLTRQAVQREADTDSTDIRPPHADHINIPRHGTAPTSMVTSTPIKIQERLRQQAYHGKAASNNKPADIEHCVPVVTSAPPLDPTTDAYTPPRHTSRTRCPPVTVATDRSCTVDPPSPAARIVSSVSTRILLDWVSIMRTFAGVSSTTPPAPAPTISESSSSLLPITPSPTNYATKLTSNTPTESISLTSYVAYTPLSTFPSTYTPIPSGADHTPITISTADDDTIWYLSPADMPAIAALCSRFHILNHAMLHSMQERLPDGPESAYAADPTVWFRMRIAHPTAEDSDAPWDGLVVLTLVAPHDPAAHFRVWLRDHALGLRVRIVQDWAAFVATTSEDDPMAKHTWPGEEEQTQEQPCVRDFDPSAYADVPFVPREGRDEYIAMPEDYGFGADPLYDAMHTSNPYGEHDATSNAHQGASMPFAPFECDEYTAQACEEQHYADDQYGAAPYADQGASMPFAPFECDEYIAQACEEQYYADDQYANAPYADDQYIAMPSAYDFASNAHYTDDAHFVTDGHFAADAYFAADTYFADTYENFEQLPPPAVEPATRWDYTQEDTLRSDVPSFAAYGAPFFVPLQVQVPRSEAPFFIPPQVKVPSSGAPLFTPPQPKIPSADEPLFAPSHVHVACPSAPEPFAPLPSPASASVSASVTSTDASPVPLRDVSNVQTAQACDDTLDFEAVPQSRQRRNKTRRAGANLTKRRHRRAAERAAEEEEPAEDVPKRFSVELKLEEPRRPTRRAGVRRTAQRHRKAAERTVERASNGEHSLHLLCEVGADVGNRGGRNSEWPLLQPAQVGMDGMRTAYPSPCAPAIVVGTAPA